MNLFLAVCDKHAPIRKLSVRSVKAPWMDNELKSYIRERNLLKKSAIENGSPEEWHAYHARRNKITKMNKQKKKQYYRSKFAECRDDSKKMWRILNDVVGKGKVNNTSTFVECDGPNQRILRIISTIISLKKLTQSDLKCCLGTVRFQIPLSKKRLCGERNAS